VGLRLSSVQAAFQAFADTDPERQPLLGGIFERISNRKADLMRKSVVIVIAALLAVSGALLGIATSQASAAGTAPHFSVTGSTLGVQSASAGQNVAFYFTATNTGSTSEQSDFTYSLTNTSVDGEGYICPLNSNGADIAPDTPSCELGALLPGHTAQSAILVTIPNNSSPVHVKACLSNEASRRLVCKTLTVS
jgi:hypothetical protein